MLLDPLSIQSQLDFKKAALALFKYQHNEVPIYKRYCNLLKINPKEVSEIAQIPFLPITFFKQEAIIANAKVSEKLFTSSGTTTHLTSKHYVADLQLYETSFTQAFTQEYGPIEDYTILALLPNYLAREGSSLVYMVDQLITKSVHPESGFYLTNLEALAEMLQNLEFQKKKTILLGVSYALLDLLELKNFKLKHTIIMETGGMKGRRKELIKKELHQLLKKGFGVTTIHSEYGMTELLSQAYSKGEGIFTCPPWMQILTRDTLDPLQLVENKTGGINVIDLANQYSCAFIATQDLGKVYKDGSFEIMGRFDSSDIRGCNLMVQ